MLDAEITLDKLTWSVRRGLSVELYHGVTSSFLGISILPVSDLTGRSVFRSVLLVWRELLFSGKGGLAVSKRGLVPPFSLKKGAGALSLREKGVPVKKMIPKCTDQDFLWYRYGKYQEIPTDTDRKIPIQYTTLLVWYFFLSENMSLVCLLGPLK
jgi:hypothetical protein